MARGDMPLQRRLVDSPLAARLEKEMLDGVCDVHAVDRDARFVEQRAQQSPCRTDEWPSLPVLLVAGLLADEHQRASVGPSPVTPCVACSHNSQRGSRRCCASTARRSFAHRHDVRAHPAVDRLCAEATGDRVGGGIDDVAEPRRDRAPRSRCAMACRDRSRAPESRRLGDASQLDRSDVGAIREPARGEVVANPRRIAVSVRHARQESRRVVGNTDSAAAVTHAANSLSSSRSHALNTNVPPVPARAGLPHSRATGRGRT